MNSKKHKPVIIDLIKLNNKYHLYNKNTKHKFKVFFYIIQFNKPQN